MLEIRIPILDKIEAKINWLIKAVQMTQQQQADLIAAVKAVKDDSDAMAVRVDKIIAALGTSPDPVVAQAVSDLGAVSKALKAYHADTTIPPVGP